MSLPSIFFVAALIPLVTGSLWYNPKTMGKAWMRSAMVPEERLRTGNFPLILLACYVLSVLLAFALFMLTIHQVHVYSMLQHHGAELKDPNSPLSIKAKDFMGPYLGEFRTFKHGAFHGILSAITIVLPVVGTIALFERRSFKYVAIHVGYFMLTFALMGGVICQWAKLG